MGCVCVETVCYVNIKRSTGYGHYFASVYETIPEHLRRIGSRLIPAALWHWRFIRFCYIGGIAINGSYVPSFRKICCWLRIRKLTMDGVHISHYIIEQRNIMLTNPQGIMPLVTYKNGIVAMIQK